MENELKLQIIGHIYNDYGGKFGVPRQSSLVEEVISRVVLLPEFRRAGWFFPRLAALAVFRGICQR